MIIYKNSIIYFFRYLWLGLALVVILFILNKAIFTKRILVYNLDFYKPLSRDIVGWYPEQRISHDSGQSQETFRLLAEPVYLKVYSPTDFKSATLEGDMDAGTNEVNIGVRQKDGSWQFKPVEAASFSLDFDLSSASIKRNQLEFILSLPSMSSSSSVYLVNDWKIILKR
jgi:hypothetical protein